MTPISLLAQPRETKAVSSRNSFLNAVADTIPCASGLTKETLPPMSLICRKHARTDACSMDVVSQCVFSKVRPWNPFPPEADPSSEERSDLKNSTFFAYPRIARLFDSVIPDVKRISPGLHPNSAAIRAREFSRERDALTPS